MRVLLLLLPPYNRVERADGNADRAGPAFVFRLPRMFAHFHLSRSEIEFKVLNLSKVKHTHTHWAS